MKRFLTILACVAGIVALVSSCGGNARKKAQEEAAAKAAADSVAAAEQAKLLDEKIAALPDEPVFDIITTMGVIKVKL